MEKTAKIFVAGHKGLVGSALCRQLDSLGYKNVLVKNHAELDLTNQKDVADFFTQEKPDYVFLAAAKVGGIHANNTYPADFIFQNLAIQNNVIHNSYLTGVKRLLFLGSSCIYPRASQQPMKEEYLLTGEPEPTNEAYAIAKITGIKMCHAYNKQFNTKFLAVMPTNLYGPNDNYDLQNSHVLPALIRKFHEAKSNQSKEVVVWGTGTPRREFLYSDDLADACVFLMNCADEKISPYFQSLINIGMGTDLTIRELAETIREVVGFNGDLVLDSSKPDGTKQKLLDVSRLKSIGWQAKIDLKEGLKKAYADFCRGAVSAPGRGNPAPTASV